MASALEMRGVAKRYALGEQPAVYSTLREAIAGAFYARNPRAREGIWALRDVELEVDQGDLLGIVGRNGAGKTTLLKLVSRITEPTVGVVRVRGQVGTLLEVGTGFHPELTGRENIFLNGAILGMSRRDTRAQFEAIVSFSGIDPRFLDTPLKRYSVGMRLRLAFAIAAHLESDVVVVDEVLAVGDAEFQRRCIGAMSDLTERGRTVLFASHDMGAISRLCRRAIRLEGGRIVGDGSAEKVIADYRAALADAPVSHITGVPASGPAEIRTVTLLGPDLQPVRSPSRAAPFTVALEVEVREAISGMHPAIIIRDSTGAAVINEIWTRREESDPFSRPGTYRVRLTLPPILTQGEYMVEGWIGTQLEDHFHANLLSFMLAPVPGDPDDHAIRPRLIELPDAAWSAQIADEPSAS